MWMYFTVSKKKSEITKSINRRTLQPHVAFHAPFSPLADGILGSPEFSSSATLANNQLVSWPVRNFNDVSCYILLYIFYSLFVAYGIWKAPLREWSIDHIRIPGIGLELACNRGKCRESFKCKWHFWLFWWYSAHASPLKASSSPIPRMWILPFEIHIFISFLFLFVSLMAHRANTCHSSCFSLHDGKEYPAC